MSREGERRLPPVGLYRLVDIHKEGHERVTDKLQTEKQKIKHRFSIMPTGVLGCCGRIAEDTVKELKPSVAQALLFSRVASLDGVVRAELNMPKWLLTSTGQEEGPELPRFYAASRVDYLLADIKWVTIPGTHVANRLPDGVCTLLY